ncbi:MAG: hypothetical protein PHW10_00515 [Candidatus Peribacteraceae bacterium]|nr:hypothetical protein [Candidatus Peribacteraceae bacterium]
MGSLRTSETALVTVQQQNESSERSKDGCRDRRVWAVIKRPGESHEVHAAIETERNKFTSVGRWEALTASVSIPTFEEIYYKVSTEVTSTLKRLFELFGASTPDSLVVPEMQYLQLSLNRLGLPIYPETGVWTSREDFDFSKRQLIGYADRHFDRRRDSWRRLRGLDPQQPDPLANIEQDSPSTGIEYAQLIVQAHIVRRELDELIAMVHPDHQNDLRSAAIVLERVPHPGTDLLSPR